MNRMIALCAASAISGAMAIPAQAQSTGNERIMMVTIPEGAECPTSDEPDTIVVCDEISDGEQYRIPRQLRRSGSPENRSWTDRARDLEDVGNFGPGSCTNIGAGSEIGCSIQEIENASAEREQAPERRFSQQIDQARQERLSTIEGEAARTQARVEELEREYMEQLEAERDAPLPGEEEPLPELEVVDPDAIPQRPPSDL
jgi:hypothetical protein